jgi:hypothetical protein
MNTVDLGLQEIYDLALSTLKFNGCDNMNAEAVSHMVYLESQVMLLLLKVEK